jgi:hypothetical protein
MATATAERIIQTATIVKRCFQSIRNSEIFPVLGSKPEAGFDFAEVI